MFAEPSSGFECLSHQIPFEIPWNAGTDYGVAFDLGKKFPDSRIRLEGRWVGVDWKIDYLCGHVSSGFEKESWLKS
jgi:hypothetical protein